MRQMPGHAARCALICPKLRRPLDMSRNAIVLSVIIAAGLLNALAGCLPSAMHVLTLNVTPTNAGKIIITPERTAYFAGTEVELEAVPVEGWVFQNWIGASFNTTTNPTKLRVYADQTINAVFGLPTDPTEPSRDAVIKNGGFESSGDSAYWTAVSSGGLPIICNLTDCGTLNGLGAASGNYWAWLGNDVGNAAEAATLIQDVFIPNHEAAWLVFNVAIPMAENTFAFQVLLGAVPVFQLTEADVANYGSYQLARVNITDLIEDTNVPLTFSYLSRGGASQMSAVFVDNISIELN